jgi:hypothetical protein
MAETLISPGVLARENDRSQVTASPLAFGAAIIGPTVKGPVEIPTLVTTYSEYQNKFGTTFISGSDVFTYFTSIAAYNYFNNGGTSLLVARVVSGSFTGATSSNIINDVPSTPGAFATASVPATSFVAASFTNNNEFRITGSDGEIYRFIVTSTSGTPADDIDGKLFYFASGSGAAGPFISSSVNNLAAKLQASPLSASFVFATSSNQTPNLIISSSTSGSALNGIIFSSGSGTSFSTQATLGGGVNGVGSNTFILKTISAGTIMNSTSTEGSNGILPSGSTDNVRWQITNRNTSSGTFDLLIRQGNDTTTEPIVLETWTGLSLDPTAPNFISKIIGDTYFTYDSNENYIKQNGTYPNQSRYVYVSSVLYPTPYYFDNNGVAKSAFTSSIPTNATGTFGSATGTVNGAGGFLYYQNISGSAIDGNKIQGIPSSSYDNMIRLLANQDDYKFNILLTPGLFDQYQSSQVTSIISNTQNRGDNIYVLDLVGYGATVSTTTTEANSRNTSYAASYWPWVQTIDPDSGQNVWVPASTLIGGVYAFNDSVGEPWFAPAGINRGGLGTVIRAERKLSQANRDTLYSSKVNPIATFPGTGVVVYGQKTLQTKASALDRVNVRRLLIALKSYISQVALNLVFEQNTIATRNQFLSQVNPYLESVQQRQGLYAFKVVMDESNNTPDAIDRNQMIGAIYLQPTKTAEFIYLDFNITPTGATFPA